MTSFDFDVISDTPPPRVIKPADVPKTEAPLARDAHRPEAHRPEAHRPEAHQPAERVPQSDAA